MDTICPLCSGNLFECGHEILCWPYVANEFEPSSLIDAVKQLENAAKILLARALDLGVSPSFPDLRVMYDEVHAEGGLDI